MKRLFFGHALRHEIGIRINKIENVKILILLNHKRVWLSSAF